MAKSRVVVTYSSQVAVQFETLVDTLYEQAYFGSRLSAIRYVAAMKSYIRQNIASPICKRAPSHFSLYDGQDLYYLTYQPNKATTWYIFFLRSGNKYAIQYITNNHVAGQHIRK
jgi:hypothetical protein